MSNRHESIISPIAAYFSEVFVYLYRYVSLKPFFRSSLNYVPSSLLRAGGRIIMRSFDESLLGSPNAGSVALVVQSGSLKIIMLNQLAREGLGVSKLIYYYGKDKDWDESQFLEDLADDPKTEVIVLCMESINNGRRFMFTAKKVSKMKPIIVFKSGKSRVGAKAVLSHVGSLAGSDEICNAAFKQSGCLRAQTIEETIDFAKALCLQSPGKGPKVGIVTNGYGTGIIAADACISLGLEVPPLPPLIYKCLRKKVPLFSGVTNPLDLKVLATSEIYSDALYQLLRLDSIDVIILIVHPTPALDIEKFVHATLTLWKKYKKPMVVCTTGSDKPIWHLRNLEKCGIPLYFLPERAAAGAAGLIYYGRCSQKP